jgi:hypothetical protein
VATFTSQPTTDAPSRANATAAARPTLPPVPVMTHTLPDSLPDIMPPTGPGYVLLDLADTNVGLHLRDFGEALIDDLARLVGERPTGRIYFDEF